MRLNAQVLGHHYYCCERMFRLDVANLLLLARSILPTTYRTSAGDITNNVEGLCIVLRRLAFPVRWYDLVSIFGRQEGSLSRIFIATMDKIMAFWGHLLQFDPSRFQHRLQEWAAAIAAHPAGIDPLLRIALFIDGTLRGTTRPHPAVLPHGVTYDMLQRIMFSGHKWFHGLKHQGITAPNGIIVGLFGPVVGCRNDCELLRRSGVTALFPLLNVAGVVYRIYGDGAYPNLTHLMRAFKAPTPGSWQAVMNAAFALVRISVEWSFGMITNTFQAVDFRRWQRVFLTRPALQYQVATFLINCISCLRGKNIISMQFNCAPPTLAEYLSGNW